MSAVAYISLNQGLAVVTSGVAVRLLPVDKVEPEVPTVKDGRYPLRRPVLLLTKKDPNPVVDAFVQFAQSAAGRQIIADTYIPFERK
jgi:phosphate transport system substrate-binding protein